VPGRADGPGGILRHESELPDFGEGSGLVLEAVDSVLDEQLKGRRQRPFRGLGHRLLG
jgi:hypothetical protein